MKIARCPGCGDDLELPPGGGRVVCPYCETEFSPSAAAMPARGAGTSRRGGGRSRGGRGGYDEYEDEYDRRDYRRRKTDPTPIIVAVLYHEVVALAFGLAASSIFPALMMGIFSKRVNDIGAVVGMLAGITSTLVYIFWFKGWFFIPGTAMAANTPDNWLLGISPEAFGAVGAAINFACAIVVSRLTASPPEHIQDLVEHIRVPSGAGTASAH